MYKVKITTFFLVLAVTIFSSRSLYAQQEDFNLWTGIEIEKEVVNNLNIGLELNNRLQNNLSQRDETFVDLGLKYDIKDLSLFVNYRLSNTFDKDTKYGFYNRFTAGAGYKFKLARFTTDLRLKYQQQYDEWQSSENGLIPENYLRSRIKLKYNIMGLPLEPYTSFETFQGLNNTNMWFLEKQRLSFGMKYDINKRNSLDFVLHRQTEINQSFPSKKTIFSISYGLELK
ncbi:MAG: DUF2490 domain-containing protein [Bacteroidales bacterium]|nr:DUF2490 domain-containing protein [Bacteroidales bacterium]MCF8391009.1 DUF2490 domain-containing protein [Bacteroidales bacterium]